MWIQRDIAQQLAQDQTSYIQIVIGPRQCGKSSLLAYLSQSGFKEVTFDDLQLRNLAQRDPAFFMSTYPPPILIDEAQYAPNLFPELKKIVDHLKRERLFSKDQASIQVLIRLTGSNQIFMDKHVKETLVGRASYYFLNTLSVGEIKAAFPRCPIIDILFRGGWPELYTQKSLSTVTYLNDYIRNYIEKDIVLSAGITKQAAFKTVLSLLAARTGNLLNYSAIAQDAGVKSVTIKEWVSLLAQMNLVYLLPPCLSNLNKRLIKTPKIYFLDTGLASRLQGWSQAEPLLNSPQAGAMFETLVLAEIVKFINNHQKSWKLSLWRTKQGEEVDFILEKDNGEMIAFDAKLGIHGVRPIPLPAALRRALPQIKQLVLVCVGGARQRLSTTCLQLPISKLASFLQEKPCLNVQSQAKNT